MDLRSARASIEAGVTTGSISIFSAVAGSNSIGGGSCDGMLRSSLISKICGVSLSPPKNPGSLTL